MYNFKEPRFSFKKTKLALASRGPSFLNKILDNNTKAFTSSSFFEKNMKSKLLNLGNIDSFVKCIAHSVFLHIEINLKLLLAVVG